MREQITRSLSTQPQKLEQFKAKLQVLTYAEITNLWQQERTSREEWESHARPIVELKEQILPEIMELIQLQRLNYLVEGTRFTRYGQRGQVSEQVLFIISFKFIFIIPNYLINIKLS